MNALLQNWGLFKIIRVALGIIILIQGILTGEIPSILIGLAFSALALMNVGCCGSNGCSTNANSNSKQHAREEVEYEEVVEKK